jgi:hypothetical protein
MTYFDPEKHPELEPSSRPSDGADEDDASVPDIRKKDWVEGDRVLAPWGRACLFPGTVGQVTATQVFVYFDDGDRGGTEKEQVRPLQIIRAGSRVQCRWRGGSHYYPGVITQMHGHQIFVQYDDGDSEWNTIGMIMVPSGLTPTAWEYFQMSIRYVWILVLLGVCLIRACG